jgi:hypothetical protein
MDRRQIQRLSASEMTPARFRDLVEHGEELLVERKAQLPEPEAFGAVVSSMANMLGGWVLLGVNDRTRKLEALDLPQNLDMQSHIGNRLRNAVDPVPPFLAGELEIDGVRVGFVRVFEAAVPVIVRGTGAVYTRDAGGKRPVSDHRVLLDLARAGREAEDQARERPNRNRLTKEILGVPPQDHGIREHDMRVIVRAAPLTVTPQLAEWPITRGASQVLLEAVEWLVRELDQDGEKIHFEVEPSGRALTARGRPLEPPGMPWRPYRAVVTADCAGVYGAATTRQTPNALQTHELRRLFIRPAIEAVSGLLTSAEAYGDAVFDLYLRQARGVFLFPERGDWQQHPIPEIVHCGSAILSIPADEDDRAELAKRWEREVGRGAGLPLWEKPLASAQERTSEDG